jgi:hypothetical protein
MKILKSIVLIILFLNLGLTAYSVSSMKTPQERLSEIGGHGGIGLPAFHFGQHPDSPPDYEFTGAGTLSSPIYFVIDFLRYLASGIAILVVVYMAVNVIVNAEEEEYKKAKTGLFMGIAGFFLIQIADVAVKNIFFGEYGEAFEDSLSAKEFASEGAATIRGIIGWVNMFLAAVVVFVIIIKGFTLVAGAGNEEELGKVKNHLIYAVVGLILISLSDIIIRGFVFPNAGQKLPNAEVGKYLIVMITNYLSGFIGFVAFVMLFYSGYRYVIEQGSDTAKTRIKNTAITSVIAILLSFAAFAIVNTFLNFSAIDPTSYQITP